MTRNAPGHHHLLDLRGLRGRRGLAAATTDRQMSWAPGRFRQPTGDATRATTARDGSGSGSSGTAGGSALDGRPKTCGKSVKNILNILGDQLVDN